MTEIIYLCTPLCSDLYDKGDVQIIQIHLRVRCTINTWYKQINKSDV